MKELGHHQVLGGEGAGGEKALKSLNATTLQDRTHQKQSVEKIDASGKFLFGAKTQYLMMKKS